MTDHQENDKQDKIYWHDAFFAALQLELHDYIDVLIFEDERQLRKVSIYLNRVAYANLSILEEDFNMFDEAVVDVICKHFEKKGILNKFREEGVKNATKDYAVKMLKKGYAPEEIADNLDMPVEWIQSLEI